MNKIEILKPLVMRSMIKRLDEKESLAYVDDQEMMNQNLPQPVVSFWYELTISNIILELVKK